MTVLDPLPLLPAALVLDLLLGDPRWLPHPVRLIGAVASWLEPRWRRCVRSPRWAGALAAFSVYLLVGVGSWLLLAGAARVHPLLGQGLGIYLAYQCLAVRDLAAHAWRVYRPLRAGDLASARAAVAMLVGRDTAELDEAELARATVESVAESSTDGILAPLVFLALAGPVGGLVYKAINTLDSCWGHRDERYARFGTVAARVDDLANWLPARLGALLFPLAALLLGRSPWRCWRILRQDGRRHPSPNAGLAEAAMAGALDCRLGGTNVYAGVPDPRPLIHPAGRPPRAGDIRLAIAVMVVLSLLASGLLILAGLLLAAQA